MSEAPKRLRRASKLFTNEEQEKPKESKPKAKKSVKRSNEDVKTVKEKKNVAAPKQKKKKLTKEERAEEKYPDWEFDPVKEAEQIFETEEFTEEQNNEEEARITAGVEKVLAKSKEALSNELAEFISELNSKKVRGAEKSASKTDKVENEKVSVHDSSEEDDDVFEEEEDREIAELECDNEEWAMEVMEMKYYAPLSRNVLGADRLILENIPMVHENTDDHRVCRTMYEKFDGVHGYLHDHYKISREQLFEAMTELLPGTKNPDLFYYNLYLIFPNHGSQETFSYIYPELVKDFVNDEGERERLLKLEHWKTPEMMMKKERTFEQPCDFKNPFSHGNYLTKSIKLPSGISNSFCSENCYNSISRTELVELTGPISHRTHKTKIFIPKTTKKDCDFLNTLILEDSKNDLVENFCQIAGRFESNTCIEWYRSVMNVSEKPDEEELSNASPKKNYEKRNKMFLINMAKETSRLKKEKERALREQADDEDEDDDPKRFQRQAVSENALNTKFCLTPCCHLGPCGHNVPFCSCDTMCSVYCQCDADCGRRFPGCRCGPNQCRAFNCPCVRLGWECIPSTCKNCTDVDHPEDPDFFGCKNKSLTYNVGKNVTIEKSGIAGNGAFIREDVKKDEFIGEYTGEYITDEEVERRGCIYNLKISYVFSLGDSCGAIDAGSGGSVMRFLNHSNTPNCFIKLRTVQGVMRIGFFAGKDIKSGTELTLNYSYDADSADMFFNVAPEERVPKYVEPSTSEKKEKPKKPRKSILKEDDDVGKEIRKPKMTVTRSGRRSVRFQFEEDPNEPSTSQASGSGRR
ncbi:unnamed protein product [Caenorhabditis brenneri]